MWSSWPWSLEIVVERLGASGRWYNLHHSHFVHGGCVILYFNNVEANVLVVCLALVVLLVSSCCCLLTFLSLQTPSAWVCLPSIAHRAREYCRRVFRLIYPCFACISPKGRRGGGGDKRRDEIMPQGRLSSVRSKVESRCPRCLAFSMGFRGYPPCHT